MATEGGVYYHANWRVFHIDRNCPLGRHYGGSMRVITAEEIRLRQMRPCLLCT